MATTRESIGDGFRWCLKILRIFTRRAIIFGIFAGLFAVAVIYTTRERVSDCSEVTEIQRSTLWSLRGPSPERSFSAITPPACRQGVFGTPIDGISGTIEGATEQLVTDGWRLETEFLPHFDHLWRRCFSLDEPGWEQVQITVDALRSGSVEAVEATAPEGAAACDLERRDASKIYPPSS